jgi:hypothetical protein
MTELIGELDEGGAPLCVPADWPTEAHAGSLAAAPRDGSLVVALMLCALSGATIGLAIGFALGFLLS